LIAAFEKNIQLNQAILESLQKGQPLNALDELFAAKASSLEVLKKASAALGDAENPSSPEMAQAHQVQASAARLEAKLAEILGEKQRNPKSVSAVTKAYGPNKIDKASPGRLDLES
jgi:hypothetical protein